MARNYPLYGLTEEPQLRAIFREAKVWWLSNELEDLVSESRRWLICEVFQRSSNEAALLALALFGGIEFPELRLADIEVMQSWFEGAQVPARNVRDALVLKVWLPWFTERPNAVVEEKLREWLHSAPGLVRAALVTCVGLAQEVQSNEVKSLVMASLGSLASQRDREVGSAIGWFLATMWHREPELVERWLNANAARLSRRVYRIAVGRMPTSVRVRLLEKWKASRPHF